MHYLVLEENMDLLRLMLANDAVVHTQKIIQ